MKTTCWPLILLLPLSAGQAIAAPEEDKVTICHVPAGNPANAHSITIGASAVAAHAAHGDDVSGGCASEPAPPPPGSAGVLTICSSRGNSGGHQLSISSIGRVSHIKISCD